MNSQIAEKNLEFSERFSKAQSERSDEYQEFKNSTSEELTTLRQMAADVSNENAKQRADAEKLIDDAKNEFEGRANYIIGDLNEILNQAGQDTLASGFAGESVAENTQFIRYTLIASTCFLTGAIILAMNIVALIKTGNYDLISILKQLPVSIVILLPSFYFASLANDHRKSSVKLRSLGLRIQAFGAYIANIDDAEKTLLRRELVKEFFEEKTLEKRQNGLFDRSPTKNADQVIELAKSIIERVPRGK